MSEQNFLRHDGGHEPIERLLGAAVGVVDEVGQRIDHGTGEGGAVADFERGFVPGGVLCGHLMVMLPVVVASRMTPEKLSVLSMPWM